MGRPSFALAALLIAGLSSPTVAGAQWRAPQRGGTYDVQGGAYDNGYRSGLQQGTRDSRDGRAFELRRHEEYRDADRGYDRRYGNRGQYKQAFRDGFERGYDEGYRRYGRSGRAVPRDRGYGYPGQGRYPNAGRYPTYPGGRDGYGSPRGSYGYYSPAYDKGFSEGYEKGLDDARDGDRFQPERHKWYREGDRGYKNSYVSRDRYKVEYRDAFRQGYEQGYRDSHSGYGRQTRRWPF